MSQANLSVYRLSYALTARRALRHWGAAPVSHHWIRHSRFIGIP